MPSYARSGATSWGPSSWFFSGNVMDGDEAKTADNWKGVDLDDVKEYYTEAQLKAESMIRPALSYYKYTEDGSASYDYDKYAYAIDNYEMAEDAYNNVLKNVGTWNRDNVEQRLVNEVKTRTCQYGDSYGTSTGIIDTEAGAEGFYAYATDYTVPVDTDADGMPDDWEVENGCDPNVADNNRLAASGYTMLEVYLNSFFDGKSADDAALDEIYSVTSNAVWLSADGMIHCSVEADYTVTMFDMSGRIVARSFASGSEFALPSVRPGVSLVVVEAPGVATRVLKVLGK